MKKYLFLIAFLSFFIGVSQNLTKNLSDFNQLKLYDGLTLRLIKSDENKAVVSGKYASNVQFVLKNDLLKVKLDTEKQHINKAIHVDLYYKNLFLLDANEGSFITAKEKIKSLDLEVKAQEGAEISLEVETKRLTVRSISGSDIEIVGVTENQEITANSGANYNGRDLKSNQTSATSSSGATIRIQAKEIAKVTSKTGGMIRVYGNPKMIDQKKVLGGTITIVD